MKNAVKILLLTVAVVLAVVLVMFFYKTIVAPPQKMEFNNQYVQSVNKDIERIQYANTDNDFDSFYIAVVHEIDLQYSNSFLTDQERDELLENFAKQYVPQYKNHCNSKFQQSIWNEGELNVMRKRISELKSLQAANNKIVIQGNLKNDLDYISSVVDSYYDAKKTAVVSGFYGREMAIAKINKAKDYISKEPLCNCVSLVSDLKSVPERLGDKHYKYLSQKIDNNLNEKAYQSLPQEQYNARVTLMLQDIDLYDNDVRNRYYIYDNSGDLRKKVGDWQREANSYYRSLNSNRSDIGW